MYILRLLSLFHLTSDAHPVVRPETLLFPNETYIFFISYKKSVISFSSRQITFWIVIIISPLINYPLSVFFFFLSTQIRFPVECSKYYPPSTYFFYGITTTRWFHLHQIRLERDKFIAVERFELLYESENFSKKTIYSFSHRIIVKWRVYIIPIRHYLNMFVQYT